MVAKITALGPLQMPKKFADWDAEMEQLEHAAQAAQTKPEGELAHV
jgi:hypothetical protein